MRAAAIILALAAAGCFSPDYPENLACSSDGWCPPGQVCNAANVCIARGDGSDAAPVDASVGPDGPDALQGLGQLVGISIGDDVTIAVGETHQFPLIGIYENGMEPITDFAIWESSQTTVFFIDFNGLATGEGAGTATATCRYNGRVDTAQVTVTP